MLPTRMFPFRVQIQQYLPAHGVDGHGHTHRVKHKDVCYLSFVNLSDFVHTEIWASQFPPLGLLLILTKVVCFMHGDKQKASCATSLRIQISNFLSILLSTSDILFHMSSIATQLQL